MRASVSGTVILLDMSDMHILLHPKVLVSGGNTLIYKQLLGVWPFLCTNNTAFLLLPQYLALPEKLCLI